jgi:Protein of unknown function (DUF2961)
MNFRDFSPGLLGGLPFGAGLPTRQINAENPTGEKGGGCRRDPDPSNPDLPHSGPALDLGRGWKVRPFIRLKAGETATLAQIEGPGCITHFFITSNVARYRELVLRCHWDGEAQPSVEVPLGDFFAMGHDEAPHDVSSLPVTVAPRRGCNCHWPMPFRKSARMTLENSGSEDAHVVAYTVLYHLHPVPAEAAYFHAQWRRSTTPPGDPQHTILDGVRGRGLYVGTALAWTARGRGWWGEGEVKFFLDGDGEFPTLADSGTEDYFGGAWCFDATDGKVERTFNSPFLGLPLARTEPGKPRLYSLYRWHVPDGIGFERDLRVTVQALGWSADKTRYAPLTDEIASVGYWYQHEPHAPFPALPPVAARTAT